MVSVRPKASNALPGQSKDGRSAAARVWLVVRVLEPWFENLSKRQVKAPKVYVRDTGLLHALLGIGFNAIAPN